MSDTLKPGDPAPPFRLQDGDGAWRTLAEFEGRPLVVYFFPMADTSG